MREDIKSLKICGGKFASEICFPFWGNTTQANKKTPCALLYGRNGCGKSTIARAFRKIAGNEEETINSAKLCGELGNELHLTEEEKSKVYVFDQKFIDENIRFKENGLNTIVMLGSQLELDKQIEELEKKLNEKKDKLDSLQVILDRYNDDTDYKSPKYYLNKMEKKLKGDANWAGRDKLIKNIRINTSVRFDTYRKFISLKPKKSRDDLLVLFQYKYKELESARNGAQRIERDVPTNINGIDIDYINKLLAEKIEKPILSSRERFLVDISKKRGINFLYNIETTFSDKNVATCPFCARTINDNEKHDIVKGIEAILNKLVKEHQNKLDNSRPKKLILDLSPFIKLGELAKVCIKKLEIYNNFIDQIDKQIAEKISNPYQPIFDRLSKLEFDTLKNDLLIHLFKLEEEKNEYNKRISDVKPIVFELNRINAEIAHWDIIEIYKLCKKSMEEKKKNLSLVEDIKLEYGKLKYRKEQLDSKKKNVNIAVDFINHRLNYIFFSENRLKLKYIDGNYQLLVNGSPVKPNQISTGETNAIALCYFFSKICHDKPLEKVYNENYLIIIDDPITSFDNENKVGMLSYLKSQVQEFILGNLGTKFLVMTHDMMTFTSIFHINEELSSVVKDKYANFAGTQLKNKSWLLCDSKLEEYKSNEANEYSRLYNLVYDFAKGSSEASSLPIGNLMRQLMEAFSTFQYKIGITELSTKENVISLLPNEYKNYFRNYMYRLVLNSGSHKENEAKFNLDMDFQSLYTLDEKKRTAKSILCFLYLLNKEHVLAHMWKKSNEAFNKQVEADFNIWCEEIKNKKL